MILSFWLVCGAARPGYSLKDRIRLDQTTIDDMAVSGSLAPIRASWQFIIQRSGSDASVQVSNMS